MKRVLPVVFLALVSARAVAQTCSPTTFVTATFYAGGTSPASIETGDFTGDGTRDLVLISGSDEIDVLPGIGDGSFGPPLQHLTDVYGAYAAAVGLFDAGSNLDVAIAFYDGIRVFPGDGAGSFGDPILTPTSGFQPYGFVAADFDGDGHLDLAMANGGGSVYIFLGNDDGTFTQQPALTAPGGAISLSVGKLDPGDTIDLVASGSGGVTYWAGLGNGNFGPPQVLPLGGNVSTTVVADLNGDGVADIGVAVDAYVAVFVNSGDGTFQAAIEYPTGFTGSRLAAADVDGDGLTDLVVLQGQYPQQDGSVAVLLQKPDGSLDAARGFNGGQGAVDLTAADFNGDGMDDVATASTFGFVAVLLGSGGGELQAVRVALLAQSPSQIVSGDFFGDGRAAFASLNYDNGSQVTILRVDSESRLVPGPSTLLPVFNANAITDADFNGDGKLDLAVGDYNSTNAFILLGHGDGTFDDPVPYQTGQNPTDLIAGDFDGDGLIDLAAANYNQFPFSFTILRNTGGGVFSLVGSINATAQATQTIAADLNGDGFADLVTVTSNGCCSPSPVTVYVSNGDGTFQPGTDYDTGASSAWVGAADFDEDGHLDLITANNNASNVSLLKGDGHGAFAAPILIAISGTPISLLVGDFDSLGHQDVLAVENSAGKVSLLRGLGDGNFHLPEDYFVGLNPLRALGGHFAGPGAEAAILNASNVAFLREARLAAAVSNLGVTVGSPAVLSARVSGFGTITYQWRKNATPLSDGGTISGATTATLTIDPVAFTDAGLYDVLVADSCTSAASNASTLSVEFDDVPLDNPFHNDIITIATEGITGGCTTTSYCPSNPVSRAEMAVFLLKSKYGADHVPPPPPPVPIFPDVPADAFAAAWIDELATLGVTGGCGGGLYCPDRPVSRAEMAVFLLKTLLGSGYVPPPPAGIFADVPADNFAIAWIEDLYNRGITAGCASNPLRYCPDAIVPREQMATFIVRTFGL